MPKGIYARTTPRKWRQLKPTVGYKGIHNWMTRTYGQPKYCESCDSTNAARFDWANISGEYLRDRSDWERLCRSCHMKKDGRGISACIIMNEARCNG